MYCKTVMHCWTAGAQWGNKDKQQNATKLFYTYRPLQLLGTRFGSIETASQLPRA